MGKGLKQNKNLSRILTYKREKEKALRAMHVEWGCARDPNPNAADTKARNKKNIYKKIEKQRTHRGGHGPKPTNNRTQGPKTGRRKNNFLYVNFVPCNTGLDTCLLTMSAATQDARQVREQMKRIWGF